MATLAEAPRRTWPRQALPGLGLTAERFADRLRRHNDDLERERGRMDLFVAKHRQGKRGHVRASVQDDLSRIGNVVWGVEA